MAGDGPAPPLNVPYAVCEVLVAACAVVGNALVILVFRRDRRLRRRTNYYIVSLAVADLLVGLIGIPAAVMASVGLPRNLHLCLFTVSLLVVLCTISIFCLVAVSVDRYWAILHPMGYSRNVRTKTAIDMRNPSHPTHAVTQTAAEVMCAPSGHAPAREDVMSCQSASKLFSGTIRNSSDTEECRGRVRVEVGLPERARRCSSISDRPTAPLEVVVTYRAAEDPAVSCPCACSFPTHEAEHTAEWGGRPYRPGHCAAAGAAMSAGDGNAGTSPERTREPRVRSRQEQSGGDIPRTGEDNLAWRAERVTRNSGSKNSRRRKRQDHISVETVSDINEKIKVAWPAERMSEDINKGYEDTSITAAADKVQQNVDFNGNRIFMEPHLAEKSIEMLFTPQRNKNFEDSRISRKYSNSESPRSVTEIEGKISKTNGGRVIRVNRLPRKPDSQQKESKIPSESLKVINHALVDSAPVLPSGSKNLLERLTLESFQQKQETPTGMSNEKKVDSAKTKGNTDKFDTKTLPQLITETCDFSPVSEKLGECMRNNENGAASTDLREKQEPKFHSATCETVHVDQGRNDYRSVTGTKVVEDIAGRVVSNKGDDVEDAGAYGRDTLAHGLTNATHASGDELLPGTLWKYGDCAHPEWAAMDELKRYVTRYPEFINYYFQKRRVASLDSDIPSRENGYAEPPIKSHCSGNECDVSHSSSSVDIDETNDKGANNAEPQLPPVSDDAAMLRHLKELHDNKRLCDRSSGDVSADESNSGKCVSRTSSSDDDQSSCGVLDDLYTQPFSVTPLVSGKMLVKKSAISRLLLADERCKITSIIVCSKKKSSPSLRESRPISKCKLQNNTITPIVCDRHSGDSENTHLKYFQEQNKGNEFPATMESGLRGIVQPLSVKSDRK